MDGEATMTTEVQIGKNRRYLPHLRKIVACIAARLGMSRKDIADAEDAVSAVCWTSIDQVGEESDDRLSIRLATHGTCMTVEISDPCVSFDPICSGHGQPTEYRPEGLERLLALTDDVEFVRGDEGTTIRLTKYAERLRPAPTVEPAHSSAIPETANLHA